MRKHLIKFLGGYPDIDSAIQAIKDTNDIDKKAGILTLAVKKLYNAISADDILRQEGNDWVFMGKPLMGTEISNLKQEAAHLRSMKLWLVIKKDIRYQLSKKMFEEATVKEDLVWGKLLTFLDDIIRARIDRM